MFKFEVQFLGTSGAVPAYGRFPCCQLVNIQERLYMVDCGEGAQMRIAEYQVKWGKIGTLFISHMHGDHIYGIIGLLTSMSLNRRTQPFTIYGPSELESFIKHQLNFSGELSFPLQFQSVDPTKYKKIYEDEVSLVYSIPLNHSIPTCGFLFKEKERPRNMIAEKIKQYEIPYQYIPAIKDGANFQLPDGEIIPNKELTKPPLKARSYAFCSDTAYTEAIVPFVSGVDLLYHEATFTDEHKQQAIETMHSTARQAAAIALQANAKQLILGHFSSRYKILDALLGEAKEVFFDTKLAIDGLTISI